MEETDDRFKPNQEGWEIRDIDGERACYNAHRIYQIGLIDDEDNSVDVSVGGWCTFRSVRSNVQVLRVSARMERASPFW